MPFENNKSLLRRHFEEVLNQGQLDVVDEIYADSTSWTRRYRLTVLLRHMGKRLGVMV